MQKYFDTVLRENGTPIAGATVTVKNYPSGTTATIYSDNGVTPASNPVSTDARGLFYFYAADGRYTLVISSADTGTLTLEDILIEDPATGTGMALTNPTINGTVSTTGLTMPAFTSGAINGTTIPSSKTLAVTTDKLSAFAATTSAELAGVISDETGTGSLVFGTNPTLTGLTLAGAVTGGGQNISGLGTLGCGAISSTGQVQTTGAIASYTDADAIKVGISGSVGTVAATRSGGNYSSLEFKTSGADGNGVTRLTLDSIGQATFAISGTTQYTFGSSALTTGSGITSLAFNAGNPSLNIGTGALTAGSGTFSGDLIESGTKNLRFNFNDGGSYFANIFNQASSAALILANGMQYRNATNGWGSSYASSWARSAVAVDYGAVKIYADGAATIPIGDAVTPTLVGTFSSTGLSLGSLALTAGSGTFSASAAVTNPIIVKDTAGTYAYNNNFILFRNSADGFVGSISHPAATTLGILGADGVNVYVGASSIGTFSSTGLSVTGTGTFNQNSTGVVGRFYNADTTNGYGVVIAAGGTATTRYGLVVRNSAETQDWFKISSETGQVGNAIFSPGGTTVGTFSSTGLSVTGSVSATTAATSTAIKAIASSSGDIGGIRPNAAGNGAEFISLNAAETAYTPLKILGSTVKIYTDTAGGTLAATFDASGNLLVGTTTPSASSGPGVKVSPGASSYVAVVSEGISYYAYNQTAGAYRFYVTGAGEINATSTSITAISDVSLKENIRDLETGLTEVMALKPRRFDWKNGDSKNVAGFIAQELEEVLPELVYEYKYTDTETKKSIKMGDILPTLVKAVQELSAKNDALEARLAALEAK